MNQIALVNETDVNIDDIVDLNDFICFVANKMKLDKVLFNVIIVNNEKIREINRTYRNIDKATDVISFALEDDNSFIETDSRILGDIYISIEKTIVQAKEYGHSTKRELLFLTIHGILHLLGYDHMNVEDEKIMFELQELILDEYR